MIELEISWNIREDKKSPLGTDTFWESFLYGYINIIYKTYKKSKLFFKKIFNFLKK
jgi:hypothetical protein